MANSTQLEHSLPRASSSMGTSCVADVLQQLLMELAASRVVAGQQHVLAGFEGRTDDAAWLPSTAPTGQVKMAGSDAAAEGDSSLGVTDPPG